MVITLSNENISFFFFFNFRIMDEVVQSEEHMLANSTTSFNASKSGDIDDICELPRRLFEVIQEAELVLDYMFR